VQAREKILQKETVVLNRVLSHAFKFDFNFYIFL